MHITHLTLQNWRNFHTVEVNLGARMFLIGPNGSGKSNLLDVFRFLRDIAAEGLQKAVHVRRGGIHAIRCFSARQNASVEIGIRLEDQSDIWTYRIVLNQQNGGRPFVKEEVVTKNGLVIESRPGNDDIDDPERLFSTSLEQVVANHAFRRVSDFLKSVSYQHLIPQMVRDPDRAGTHAAAGDSLGRDFLQRLWRTPERTRIARLKRICDVLKVVVPQLTTIEVAIDEAGVPHLAMRSAHWRRGDARQTEREISDGTLRLLGLLWGLLDGDGPLLVEEPEMSLHTEVVSRLPQLIERINGSRRTRRQILISTHSDALLRDKGIAADEVIRLEPGREGTQVLESDASDKELIKAGLSVADVILPKSAPKDIIQLALVS